MTNITPILETYGQQLETVQTSQTFSDILDTVGQFIFQTLLSHWLKPFHIIMNLSQ